MTQVMQDHVWTRRDSCIVQNGKVIDFVSSIAILEGSNADVLLTSAHHLVGERLRY